MMAAYADKAPWIAGYKRVSKKTMQNAGWRHSLNGGFTQSPELSYKNNIPIPKRKIRLANGRYVYTYDTFDPGEIYIFNRDNTFTDSEREYVDGASFNPKYTVNFEDAPYNMSTNKYSQNYCGHICCIEYAPVRQIMRVTFSNTHEVFVYYRIPQHVYGELYWLARDRVMQTSTVSGETRHALGIHFWDLIRIKHSHYGGRYKFRRDSGEYNYEKKGRISQSSQSKEFKKLKNEEFIEEHGEQIAKGYNNKLISSLIDNSTDTTAENKRIKMTNKQDIVKIFGGSENYAENMLDDFVSTIEGSKAEKYRSLSNIVDKFNYLSADVEDFNDWINDWM